MVNCVKNCVKNCDIFHGSLSLPTHTHIYIYIFKFQHNLFDWVVLDRKFRLIRWCNHQASKRDQLVKNMALNLFHHFFCHNSDATDREWLIITFIWRVRLDIAYFAKNWKLCNTIIFKYVNNIMGPIFNENFVEKRGLWVL